MDNTINAFFVTTGVMSVAFLLNRNLQTQTEEVPYMVNIQPILEKMHLFPSSNVASLISALARRL